MEGHACITSELTLRGRFSRILERLAFVAVSEIGEVGTERASSTGVSRLVRRPNEGLDIRMLRRTGAFSVPFKGRGISVIAFL